MPRVSVCIPTYNRPELLARSVESVFGQSFQDFEVVISFDAGPCAADAFLKRYSDPRLRVMTQPVNLGIRENFNACISASRGELIKPLGDDDELAPECLEAIVSASAAVDFVVVRDKLWRGVDAYRWPTISGVKQRHRKAGLSWDRLLVDAISPTNCAFSRRLWHLIGPYRSDVGMAFDYDFTVRAYAKFDTIVIDTPLCLFRQWSGSETVSHPRRLEAAGNIATILTRLAKLHPEHSGIIARRGRRLLADTVLELCRGYRSDRLGCNSFRNVLGSTLELHRAWAVNGLRRCRSSMAR